MIIEAGGERTNVVRFPIELRAAPSLALIREMEPDVRDIVFAAEGLGLNVASPDLQERIAAETTQRIAQQVLPLAPTEQRRALDELLRPVMTAAFDACREAGRAAKRSSKAAGDVLQALATGGYWMAPLERRADALLHEAALAMVEAHRRCQEARGVSRAVGMARRGEAWVPYDPVATSEWLAEAGAALWGGTAKEV